MNELQVGIKQFNKSKFGGYRIEEVNSYLTEISEYINKTNEEKEELWQKVEVLAEHIKKYRDDEDNMKETFLNAQKLTTQIINDSKAKSESILAESREKSERLLAESKEKSDVMLQKAKERSTLIITEASSNAESIAKEKADISEKQLKEISDKIKAEEKHLVALKKEVSAFKDKMLSTYKKHLDQITRLPEYEILPEPEQPDDAENEANTENENTETNIEPEMLEPSEAFEPGQPAEPEPPLIIEQIAEPSTIEPSIIDGYEIVDTPREDTPREDTPREDTSRENNEELMRAFEQDQEEKTKIVEDPKTDIPVNMGNYRTTEPKKNEREEPQFEIKYKDKNGPKNLKPDFNDLKFGKFDRNKK